MIEKKLYFEKDIYKIFDKEGTPEVAVAIHQVAKSEKDLSIHNIIEIKTKSGSINLMTDGENCSLSWVKRISNTDLKNHLRFGNNYHNFPEESD